MEDIFEILPKNHFGPIMERTINLLLTGESVCIYGMPGYGRHYFLKMAEDILEERLKNGQVFFFEGQLYNTGLERIIKKEIGQKLNFDSSPDFYQQLRVYLANKKIILIIGHIENLMGKQKKSLNFLLRLRSLYPTHFSVLSTADHSIIKNSSEYFQAGGIIFANLIKLPPFDFPGTKRILEANKEFFGYEYHQLAKKIFHLSGGNPALIKHLGKCLSELGPRVIDKPEIMIRNPSLRIKLDDIAQIIFQEPRQILEQLEIIDKDGKLFSSLVKEYLKNYELENIEEIVPNLTLQEKRIFTYFVKSKGKIIDKDRIFFWMGLAEEKYSLWAIYKAISRLKGKIKGNYQLRNIKDQGYALESINFPKVI